MPRLFGDKLNHLRRRHGLTQAALARLLPPTTRGHINNIEVGRKEPSLDFVVRVAALFHVRVQDLLDDNLPAAAFPGSDTQPLQTNAAETRHNLGAKLRYVRTKRGMTQVDLARALGLQTQAHISLLEHGQSDVSLSLAERLAAVLGVSVDYLVQDSISIEAEEE